ncbi:MAG TPA: restriction endonuclease subunit S [Archangium sp.]|nr:restriction endonuclease subunit S [Archangium sp.]
MKTEELPPGWALASGRELFVFVTSGSRGWADFYSDTGPVFVRIGNLEHHTISLDLRETQRVQPPTGVEGTRTKTRPDDILISITADVGMVGLVRPSLGEAYINQHIALARPVLGLNAAYLAWFLTSPRGKSQLRSMERGATKKGLGLDDIRAVKFPIAPLPEQERIVGEIEKQFTRLDAGVAALKRVQAQLKRYRASVLKAACEGRLVPTEAELARREKRDYEPADKLLARILKERRARWEADQLAKMKAAGKPPKDDKWKAKYVEPESPNLSELPSLPTGWCWTTLRSISDLQGGITKGQKRSPDERLRAVPYLRVANVQRGYLDLSEMKEIEATEAEIEELRLSRGDILFNEGGDRDKLGRGWIWQEELPLCIHQNHVFRARLYSREVEPKFVSHYANSAGQRYFVEQGKQTTNLASINLTKLGNLPVPLPPAHEQRRIVAEIDDRLSLADAAAGAVAKDCRRAEKLRQAILKAAFAGELATQNPNDEPASKLLERISAAVENKPLPTQGRAKQTTAVPKMKKATR